jgi:hypothetical protein
LVEISLALVAEKPLALKAIGQSEGWGRVEQRAGIWRGRVRPCPTYRLAAEAELGDGPPSRSGVADGAGVVRCAGTHEGFNGVCERFAGRVQAGSGRRTQHRRGFYSGGLPRGAPGDGAGQGAHAALHRGGPCGLVRPVP